jgi:hypothetical protein
METKNPYKITIKTEIEMKELKNNHSRFRDAPWYPKEDIFVLIGGAGGIGSWTSLLLARAGFRIIVADFDSIEEHNMGGQFFRRSDIGMLKVDALKKSIKEFTDEDIITMPDKIDENFMSHQYVITAFDKIAPRKQMFETWAELTTTLPDNYKEGDEFAGSSEFLFIDARLEAEQLWIYCVTREDIPKYREMMESQTDENIADAPCTFKQTSHAAAMIAAHITGFFTNFIADKIAGKQRRNIPYKWEYFIPLDLLTY